MQLDAISLYQHEWMTLQNQSDSYEKFSLLIKLLNVSLACILWFSLHVGIFSLFFIGILWLQDAIWKTYQDRINQRILFIEDAIHKSLNNIYSPDCVPLQFNQSWLANRSTKRLIAEYVSQSIKPTVAYPHLGLLFMGIALRFLGQI